MTRPDPVAAALERDIAAVINNHSAENGSNTPDWIIAEYLVRCLGALDGAVTAREKWYGCEHSPAILRANPPAGATFVGEENPNATEADWRSAVDPEPVTPAVGEDDEELLALADTFALESPHSDPEAVYQCVAALASRVRRSIAELARLTEERDRLAEQIGELDGDLDVAEQERDEARATLAAVRKIADDYHDVDVVGDPPREVACNPCANDILNVLEGRKP